MNEYDSNKISDLLCSLKYSKVYFPEDANYVVFNTCHIREKANQKLYSDIGKIKKKFKNKKNKPVFILAGCIAQAESSIVFEKSDFVDIIVGPQSYQNIPELIKEYEIKKKKVINIDFDVIEKFDRINEIKTKSSKVSNFVTIQEGCDKFCKFCVVPYTRGPEYSRSIDEIIYEIKMLATNGAKEIILLGQNVSAYKKNEFDLSHLIAEVAKIKKIERIRFTTSHPLDFNDELINLFKYEDKLMPQLHLPVQSGSNKILKLMNRNYTREKYINLIDKLLSAQPKLKFSSDFIIGYPSESEQDFQDTLNLIKEINFINSYSFIYSERPGTPSVNCENLPANLTKKRLRITQDLLLNIQNKWSIFQSNKNHEVLFENPTKDNLQFFGKNIYSQPVFVENKGIKVGDVKNIRIIDYNKNTLFGKLA